MNPHLTVVFIWSKHWSLVVLTVKTLSFVNKILLISWDCLLLSWNCGCLLYFLVKWCWSFLFFILNFGWFRVHIDYVKIVSNFMDLCYFLAFRLLFQLCYSDFIKTLNFLQRLFHFLLDIFLSFSGFKSGIWSNWL